MDENAEKETKTETTGVEEKTDAAASVPSEEKTEVKTEIKTEAKTETTASASTAKKTALGVDENVEGALCYVFGLLTGIVFLLLEKDNKFVRFHAMQSILVNIAMVVTLIVLGTILMFIPIVGWVLNMLLYLAALGLWLLLMFKAYSGEKYKLPVVGDIAEQQVK